MSLMLKNNKLISLPGDELMTYEKKASNEKISFRSLNPISKDECPHGVFCDPIQAQATTATRFFRDEEIFKAIREYVYPLCKSNFGAELQVWSAGCSSGEEPYSIAMVLHGEFYRNKLKPSYTIFGTDINSERLQEARIGSYMVHKSSYMEPHYRKLTELFTNQNGSMMQLKDEIRSRMKYGEFDIRKCPKNHKFHYIVCNHVFQYYDESSQTDITANFCQSIRPGGVLYIEGLTAGAARTNNLRLAPGYKRLFLPPNHPHHHH